MADMARRELAARMAEVAAELSGTCSPAQHEALRWPFDHEERETWFYTPTDHGGLSLLEMSPTQHRLTHKLLATGLSHAGYVTANAIITLENLLDQIEGWSQSFGRERARDPLLYWIAIFGDPGRRLMGVAIRWPSHLAALHHCRWRCRWHHAVLLRCRPGFVAAAWTPSVSAAGRNRRSGSGPGALLV